MLNYNELAVQKVFNIIAFSLIDGAMLTKLDHLKTSSWANDGTVVYAQGGAGNARLIGFGHSKTSTLSCTSATVSDGAWGMQTGSGVDRVTDTDKILFTDTLVVSVKDEVKTTHTPIGEVGKEINFIYVLDPKTRGTVKTLKQAAAVAPGAFTYTKTDNKVAFNPDDVPVGTILLLYYHPNVKTAAVITNRTDMFAMNVKLVAETQFVDACTGQHYAGQLIFYKAKVSEATTFELGADSDAATLTLDFEALQSCESPKLWDVFIYDEADIEDIVETPPIP